jgi:hypothetical protein
VDHPPHSIAGPTPIFWFLRWDFSHERTSLQGLNFKNAICFFVQSGYFNFTKRFCFFRLTG